MNPVPPAARVRTPVRAWRAARGAMVRPTGLALLGLVAVLLAGILGMHALAGHGTPAAAAAVVAPAPDRHAAHAGTLAPGASHTDDEHGAASAPPVSSSSHGDPGRSGHGLGGMVALCAAMLAAAALGLLALLVGRLVRRVRLVRPARLVARIQPVRWARGTGPPPVWQFSVIRC